MRGFYNDQKKRLKEMHLQVIKIEVSLDGKAYQRPELSLPAREAAEHAGRLKTWLEELIWIAENESLPQRPDVKVATEVHT